MKRLNLIVLIVAAAALVVSIGLLLAARADLKASEAMVDDMEERVEAAQKDANRMSAICARWTQQGYID